MKLWKFSETIPFEKCSYEHIELYESEMFECDWECDGKEKGENKNHDEDDDYDDFVDHYSRDNVVYNGGSAGLQRTHTGETLQQQHCGKAGKWERQLLLVEKLVR